MLFQDTRAALVSWSFQKLPLSLLDRTFCCWPWKQSSSWGKEAPHGGWHHLYQQGRCGFFYPEVENGSHSEQLCHKDREGERERPSEFMANTGAVFVVFTYVIFISTTKLGVFPLRLLPGLYIRHKNPCLYNRLKILQIYFVDIMFCRQHLRLEGISDNCPVQPLALRKVTGSPGLCSNRLWVPPKVETPQHLSNLL